MENMPWRLAQYEVIPFVMFTPRVQNCKRLVVEVSVLRLTGFGVVNGHDTLIKVDIAPASGGKFTGPDSGTEHNRGNVVQVAQHWLIRTSAQQRFDLFKGCKTTRNRSVGESHATKAGVALPLHVLDELPDEYVVDLRQARDRALLCEALEKLEVATVRRDSLRTRFPVHGEVVEK